MKVRQSTFRRGFAATFSFDLVSRALSAVAVIVLLHALPVGDYAFVITFLAVGQLVGTAATGGLRMRHLRLEAEAVSRGGTEPASLPTALAGGTLIVVAIGLMALAIASALGISDSASRATFAGLAVAFAAGQAASELAIFHRQAHLEFSKAGAIAALRSCLLLAVAITALAGPLDSGKAVAAGFAASMLLTGAVSLWPLLVGASWSRAPLHARFGLGAESGWLTVYYVVAAGFANIDVLIITAILSKVDIASFGAAQRYYAIALGAAPALIAVLRVRTSQQDVVDSPQAQRQMLITWAKRTVVPLGLALVAGAILAPFLIPVIDGGRYPLSIPILQILLLAAFANYVTMPASNLLMAQRRYRTLAGIVALGLGANVLGDLVLGSLLGVVAVAAAATTADVAMTVAIAYAALRGSARRVTPGPAPVPG